nr:MAG TPA: hypothetical protein [Caudoviricetes sp.]
MDVIDLKFHPWKEKQMKEYIEKINNQEDKKKSKPSWWNR